MSVLLIKQGGLDTLNVKLIKFRQTLYAVWGWWTRRRRRGDGGRLSETVWRMSLEVFVRLERMHSIASNGEGKSRAQSANPGLPGKIATIIRYSQGNATFFYRNGAYKYGRRLVTYTAIVRLHWGSDWSVSTFIINRWTTTSVIWSASCHCYVKRSWKKIYLWKWHRHVSTKELVVWTWNLLTMNQCKGQLFIKKISRPSS